MFKLPSGILNKTINNNLPISILKTGKKPIKLYDQSLTYNQTVISSTVNNNIVVIPVVDIVNQNITLDSIVNADLLKINNKPYIKDYLQTFNKGTFKIVNDDLLVKLSKNYPDNKTLNLTVKVPDQREKNRDDVVPVLDFCKDWNFYGDININLNYKNHPTASLGLIVDKYDISEIREYFKNYENKVVLYDIPFRVSSYVENPVKNTVNDEYQINIELEGFYNHPLSINNPVQSLFRESNNGIPTSTKIASTNKPNFKIQSDYNKNFITISLDDLANKVGLNVKGEHLYARFPKEIGLGTSYVLENIINSRCRDYGKYPVYSNVDAIEIKDWNTGCQTYRLAEQDIISFTINDRTVKITVPPTEITWETDLDLRKSQIEKNKEFSSSVFIYDPPKQNVITTPLNTSDVTNPPANILWLETMSLNFDSSGERSTTETTYYEGESITRKIVTTYGFAFLAKDVINPTTLKIKGNPNLYWQPISKTDTIYIYDPDTGYLLGTDTTGWRLGRFSIETESLETARATITDLDLSRYQFRRIPIVQKERYVLKQLGDYYPDERSPIDAQLVWDTYDRVGNPIKRYKNNPLYVPKMFVYQTESYYNSFANLPDPRNQFRSQIDPKFPDYTTGELKRSITTNVILRSKNTTKSDIQGLDDTFNNDWQNDEDRYMSYTQNFSAQDSGYINNLQIETSEITSGRPSQHVYKKRPYRIGSSGNAVLDGDLINPDITNLRVGKTIIYTEPYTLNQISSSVSYNVRTKTDALNSANTELRENKTFNESSISLQTFFNKSIKEGDCIIVSYRGNNYITRVRSISHQIKIIDNETYTGLTNLTLGINNTESYKVYNSGSSYIDLTLPVNSGFTLGEIKDVRDIMRLKNRGNING